MNDYLVTIIMPTYNSARTIRQSLQSIRCQSLDQNKIEILIVDGGSQDGTLEVAEEFHAAICQNERKLPEFAKQIGLLEAKGRYGIFLDSDEMFMNRQSLEKRVRFLEKYPYIKNFVSTGQCCKDKASRIDQYANYIGDPFSNFIYRFNGYDRREDMKRDYSYKKIGETVVYNFEDSTRLPLFDALGNMFEIETARKLYYASKENKSFAANIFSNMVSETLCVAMLEDDYICHDPGLKIDIYINKLKWRVKNNLFSDAGVGFAERTKIAKEKSLERRKILFVLYNVLIIPPVIESVMLAVKNKNIFFILHFLFSEYLLIEISWYILLKILKVNIKMESAYGKR